MTVDIKEAVIDGVFLRFLKYHIVPRFLTCSHTTRSRFIPLHEQPILPHADSGGFLSDYCECEQERRSLSPQTIETRSTEKLSGLFDCPIPQQEHKPLTTEATMDGDPIDIAAAKEGTATHILLSLLSPEFLHGGRFVDGELVSDHNIPLQERDVEFWKLMVEKENFAKLEEYVGDFGITNGRDVRSVTAALWDGSPPSTVPPPSSSADVEELKRLMERQLALQEQRRIEEEKREEQRKRDEEQRKRDEEQRREELRLFFKEQRRWLEKQIGSSPVVTSISTAEVYASNVKKLCHAGSFLPPKVKASLGLRALFREHIIVSTNKSESKGFQPTWNSLCVTHFDPKADRCVDELKYSGRVLKSTYKTKVSVQGKVMAPDLILRFEQYLDVLPLVIFELKSSSEAWKPSSQGQIVDYLLRFMQEQQGFRSFVFGVYMTQEIVQFYKCSADGFAITASIPMPLSESESEDGFDGIDCIAGLLRADETDLGWSVRQKRVGDRDVVLEQLLGSGGYADVYAGHLLLGDETSERVVLKEFKEVDVGNSSFYSFLRERAFLSDFRDDEDLKGRIPLLISACSGSADDERPLLVVKPVGTHITDEKKPKSKTNSVPLHTPVSADIFCQLVDILKIVHSKGYVHGDIKLNNFFVHSDGPLVGKVFLNDWGSVRHINEVSSPAFRPFAPDAVLEFLIRGERFPARPEYDLYAVVCTVFSGFRARRVNEMCRTYKESKDYEHVKRFWDFRKKESDLGGSDLFRNMFTSALNLEYDALKALIRQLPFKWPGTGSG